jgi:hypothetical protein
MAAHRLLSYIFKSHLPQSIKTPKAPFCGAFSLQSPVIQGHFLRKMDPHGYWLARVTGQKYDLSMT